MRFSRNVVAALLISGCSSSTLPSAPAVSLTVFDGPFRQVSAQPYSMGPNTEILQCEGGFTFSTEDKVVTNVLTHRPSGTQRWERIVSKVDLKYKSPGSCSTYTGGSVGINVATVGASGDTNWVFLGSVAADAQSELSVLVPDGAQIQIVAVPESGYSFNGVSNSSFVSTGFGTFVFTTTVTGTIGVAPSFIKNGGTYGGGGSGGGGGTGPNGEPCPNGAIVCDP